MTFQAGTLVTTFGPDGDKSSGIVVEGPNANGLCKVLFLDGVIRARHTSKLNKRTLNED